ncbi:MAG: patatin-like phospholipase family protein [Gemmatimonadota bacterium]|nr:MAG: patatin-like phospholipase family protein [Gemmatimonadota bacterium]
MVAANDRRNKLGLAFSGGGFRASLFHLGVLRRLAELDVLRHVEILSTVSGGSILAALYILVLKKYIDRKADLERSDYLAIVEEVQSDFLKGVRKNLRTRLLLNPFATLWIIVSNRTLAQRMGRLYQRHLYKRVVEELRHKGQLERGGRAGEVPLRDVRFYPGGEEVVGGIEEYNRTHSTKIPQLVLNATTLNSGRDWRFTSVEVGDSVLGFVRYDEIELLETYRRELAGRELEQLYRSIEQPPQDLGHEAVLTAILWRLWQSATVEERFEFARHLGETLDDAGLDLAPWPVLEALCRPGLPTRRFMMCELGELRAAKLEAWYVCEGPPRGVAGGMAREQRVRRFWLALREIGADVWGACLRLVGESPELLEALMRFVIDLYYLRTGSLIGSKAKRDFERITLADAVAASACFPPVFPPYTILGLYDDTHVATLRLTDGGVFDNQGISALFEEECTHIIASDAGGLMELERRVTAGRFGMMGRIFSIMMDNVRNLQLRRLREERRVSAGLHGGNGEGAAWEDLKERYGLEGVAFFHMTTPPDDGGREGLEPHCDAEAIARIRTDLDAFGDAEIAALVYQGYALADRFVRKYLAGSPFASADWRPALRAPLPRMRPEDCRRPKFSGKTERRVIEAGAFRFFRSLKLRAWEAWLFTLVAFAGAVVLGWEVRLSLGDIVGAAGSVASRLWPFPVDRSVPVVFWLLGLAVLVAWWVLWAQLMKKLGRVRPFVTLVKWARAVSGNVLWFFGLIPVWLSILGALIAAVSHLVYNGAFLRVTGYFDRCLNAWLGDD